MSLWLARDKDGTVHFSNVKPCKPSEVYPDNPNANDEMFWIFDHLPDGGEFFVVYEGEVPELTFENSPKEVKLQVLN